MTPAAQALVRNSFAKVMLIAPQAAALFYSRLFELDPAIKPFFDGEMAELGRGLMP